MVSTDFTIFTIICWNWRLREIIDLLASHKSRYFPITEFNNCFIIRSPSLFFNGAKRSAFFTQERSQEGENHGFVYACAEYYLQPHSWTTFLISRPLFVGSYLQVTWWVFGQWKGKKFASNDTSSFYTIHLSTIFRNLGRRSFLNSLYPHPKI